MTSHSLVVQCAGLDDGRAEADKWFEATLSALAGAQVHGAIGAWRIAVGTLHGTGAVDSQYLARYQARAAHRGGTFTWLRVGADMDIVARNRLFAETGDEELVLTLQPGCIILASTVVRMVLEHERSNETIRSRELPIDRETDPDLARSARPACVLRSRESFAVDESPVSARDGHSTLWPPAVAFRTSAVRRARLAGVDSAGSDSAVPPLLAQLLTRPVLTAARDVIERSLAATGEPHLTVVMRTQLRRPEALRDALLCLAAQSDDRLELVLVVHDAEPARAREILSDQPEWLRSRTTILEATGGTRAHPLNIGLAAATGSYIAFLDDDDLVLANWAESFLNAAAQFPDWLLRTTAAVQLVSAVTWPDGRDGHSTDSPISTPYPPLFDLADHIRVNMTPFMALAFPRWFFLTFGGADEQLDVCEDWDLVLRAASVLGVVDVPDVTAIYRRWSSGNDSYALDPSIWERDMAVVRSRIDGAPILLPPGSATKLAAMAAARADAVELASVYASFSWRVTAPLRAIAARVRRLRSQQP